MQYHPAQRRETARFREERRSFPPFFQCSAGPILRQRRFDPLAADPELPGVKPESTGWFAPVDFITKNRQMQVSQMDSNLVHDPGEDLDFQVASVASQLPDLNDSRMRWLGLSTAAAKLLFERK